MGAKLSKQLAEVLAHPEAEEEAHKAFWALDMDYTGGLSFDEWRDAADAFWEAVRGSGEDHVREELREYVAARAPIMKNLVGKLGAQAVTLLAEESAREEREPWVRRLFEQADKNKDNVVSFDEFLSFLRNEATAEQREHEQRLRELVAQNVEQNDGDISVVVHHGSSTKSVLVPGLHFDPEAIRHPNSGK
jgi:Ca2+-binding EF-hand superfamily protein